MGLSSEHIPFSRSLRERVIERYAAADIPAPGNPLPTSDLTAYLAKSQRPDASPLETIEALAARDGRDAEEHAHAASLVRAPAAEQRVGLGHLGVHTRCTSSSMRCRPAPSDGRSASTGPARCYSSVSNAPWKKPWSGSATRASTSP